MNRSFFTDSSLEELHPFTNGDSEDVSKEWGDFARNFQTNLASPGGYTPSPNSVDITTFTKPRDELFYLEKVWLWATEFVLMRHIFTPEEINALDSDFHATYLDTDESLL